MALKHYDMEGGTPGAPATSALTGALLMSNPNQGGTMTFLTTSKNSGTLGVRLSAGPSDDITTRWAATEPNYRMSFAFNFRLTKLPSAQVVLATLRNATGISWRVSLRPTGGLYTDGATVSGDTSVGATIAVNKWYRIEVVADAINGTAKVYVYEGNGLTPVNTLLNQEGMDLGSEPIAAADIFCNKSNSMVLDLDDVRFDDGSSVFLGPARPTLEPSSTVRPWDLVSNTGAYAPTGTSDPVAAVADESDGTYMESINSPVGTRMMYAINPLTLGPVTVTIRHNATVASPTITRTIRLLQGTTLIAQRAITIPTGITNYSFTTTNSETNQMQWPRNNLYIEIVDTAL